MGHIHYSVTTGLAVAALALSGCFSSSSDGSSNGDGNPGDAGTLSASQILDSDEAQIAFAADDISNQVDDADAPTAPSSSSSAFTTSMAGTASENTINCDTGTFTTVENKTYNLGDLGFPGEFQAQSATPPLNEGAQLRANNCTFDEMRQDGQADIALDDTDNPSIVHTRFGGHAGANSLANLSEQYVVEGGATDLNQWGSQYFCFGCIEGDLSDLSGDSEKDVTMVANYVLNTPQQILIMGEGKDGGDYVLQTRHDTRGHGETLVDIDGRIAYAELDNPGCGYDLTFDTTKSLEAENFAASGETLHDGELTVTANNSGQQYDVEVIAADEIHVNGEEISSQHYDAIDDTCDL